ncbi:MAG: tetratricopeptide repeat protein [Intrasporangium sp.]|uniref:tetratricopeptide repeat protein n=1 Tax=Intrasporangium sp. TaxID=1925024 RepID=UPI0026471439|nr:tetratricopeptide repeat protein [Intrasporangium sp.]MDN5794369.1 tetratricopeptide repeat protein [Intrasporangium sp.]
MSLVDATTAEQAGYPYDLGDYARSVTSSSEEARVWVNRGLVWAFGFNHEEAVECFQQAVELDPDCALAYWGIAFALGPNYNKPWEFFAPEEALAVLARARTAAGEALRCAPGAAPVERALIEALVTRYPDGRPIEDCGAWEVEYAAAMGRAYAAHPDELDVACLYGEALMNLAAWQLWDQRTGRPAEGARTLEAKAVLDKALAAPGGSRHPGLLHMYLHLMEMSGTPEAALPVADLLRGLVPDAGHLQHMPTHIDVLCGDYRRVVDSNSVAIAVDARFVGHRGALNFYALYRAHNLHFKIYGALFLGQEETALQTVAELERAIPEELLHVELPPMADWLEGFVPMRVHVLVRFGRWEELIALPLPRDRDLYCTTTAMLHYGKGVAYSATGRVAEAEQERRLFQAAVERVPESRILFNNTCRDILAVADAMLDGELEYRKGNHEIAYAHLRRSVGLDDGLPYDEPWGWMQPTRHALGALLLEQGHVAEAEAVYRADLGLDPTLPRACQHPGNVWSLHGYHECLVRLEKHELAGVVEQQLRIAGAHADRPVTASCLCRIERAGAPATGRRPASGTSTDPECCASSEATCHCGSDE